MSQAELLGFEMSAARAALAEEQRVLEGLERAVGDARRKWEGAATSALQGGASGEAAIVAADRIFGSELNAAKQKVDETRLKIDERSTAVMEKMRAYALAAKEERDAKKAEVNREEEERRANAGAIRRFFDWFMCP